MVDLGIGRVQDLQSSQPGVPTSEKVHGDRSATRGKPEKVAPRDSADGSGNVAAEETIQPGPLDPEEMEREVRRLNDVLGSGTHIRFEINRDTESLYIEIVDTRSGRVIKTVSPSELQNVAARMQSGSLLVDNFR